MGYEVSYKRESTVLVNTLDFYRTSDGAISAFEWVPPDYSNLEEWLADEYAVGFGNELALDPSGLNFEVNRIAFPSFGDRSLAFKLELATAAGLLEFEVYAFCEVRNNFVGCTAIVDVFEVEEPLLQELEALATTFDQKMQAINQD